MKTHDDLVAEVLAALEPGDAARTEFEVYIPRRTALRTDRLHRRVRTTESNRPRAELPIVP